MKYHRNAKTNVYQRQLLIQRVRRDGWTQGAAAAAVRRAGPAGEPRLRVLSDHAGYAAARAIQAPVVSAGPASGGDALPQCLAGPEQPARRRPTG